MKGIGCAESYSACTGQCCAQAEGDGLHPFHVDTDELRSGAILYGRAQAVSERRTIEEEKEPCKEDNAESEGEKINDGQVEPGNAYRCIAIPGVQRHVVGGEDEGEPSL